MKALPRTARPLHALWLAAAIATPGCIETDIPPAGSYSEVLVVTEDGRGGALARDVRRHLATRLDYYISEEVQFKVQDIRGSELTANPYFKNIVLCGVASPLTHTGGHIVSLLGPEAVERAIAGKANIFKKEDLPGKGQVTVIVTGSSEEMIRQVLRERGHEVNEALERSCRRRLRGYLLGKKDSDLTRQLQRKYGFTIKVPTLYTLLSDEPDPPGIELMRDGPPRLLGIFWLDWDTTPTVKHEKELFDIRREYVYRRYDGDVMDSTRVRFSNGRLGDNPAVKMEGYWSNSRSVAGGYFESYFVYDEREKLLWVVDLLVYAPGLPKHPHFRELLALAETFRYN
ncbi:MAG: DUF4837 family protein [Candidatus Krumholzibacteriia bacterium]